MVQMVLLEHQALAAIAVLMAQLVQVVIQDILERMALQEHQVFLVILELMVLVDLVVIQVQ